METYNKFIKYYDKIVRWINSPLEEEVDFLTDLIKKYIKKDNTQINILETACGTWVVAKEFIKKWFNLTCLDINENMLKEAEKNIPKESLILWDMTEFDLWKTFDVILCNYNSICHLLELKDWRSFFRMSYNHLENWWILVFDINTLFEFENITKEFAMFYNFWDDVVCLEMFKKSNYYEWLVKMFEKDTDWKYNLTQEVVKENSFPIELISKELKNIWFKIKELIDFHYWEINTESERVYFVVQK